MAHLLIGRHLRRYLTVWCRVFMADHLGDVTNHTRGAMERDRHTVDDVPLSDEALMEGLAAGDPNSRATISARYSMSLYASAYGALLNTELAENLVSAAFAELERLVASGVRPAGRVLDHLTSFVRVAAASLDRRGAASARTRRRAAEPDALAAI